MLSAVILLLQWCAALICFALIYCAASFFVIFSLRCPSLFSFLPCSVLGFIHACVLYFVFSWNISKRIFLKKIIVKSCVLAHTRSLWEKKLQRIAFGKLLKNQLEKGIAFGKQRSDFVRYFQWNGWRILCILWCFTDFGDHLPCMMYQNSCLTKAIMILFSHH